MNRISLADRDWEARSDAKTLMESHKIQKSPKRLKAAKAALVKLEEEAEETKLEVQVAKKLKGI